MSTLGAARAKGVAPCVPVLALLALSSTAAAHSRPLSYSTLRFDPHGIEIKVQIATVDAALLAPDAGTGGASTALAGTLVMATQAGPCPTTDARVSPSATGWVVVRFRARCAAGALDAPTRLRAGFLDRLQPGHRHLVRIDDGAGQVSEHMLDSTRPALELDGIQRAEATQGVLLRYLRLGVEHLWMGFDHLAFLFGLLVLSRRLREVVWLVTSFTLAHSFTLALATLEVVTITPAPVEALIGFSIALLAAENSWLLAGRQSAAQERLRGLIPVACVVGPLLVSLVPGSIVSGKALLGLALFCACHFALLARAREPSWLRIAIAFAFGLVHGFGFAGLLQELALPAASLVPALFAFNLGVELGQLAIVIVLWPLLSTLARHRAGKPLALLSELSSAALCGLGLYWFVTRNFG